VKLDIWVFHVLFRAVSGAKSPDTQGCLSASAAVGREWGSKVRRLRMRSLHDSLTTYVRERWLWCQRVSLVVFMSNDEHILGRRFKNQKS
jgi:hypothetical protein